MFIDQLRLATAASHKALEKNPYATSLMSDQVSLHDYTAYLEKLYGFVVVFESLVYPLIDDRIDLTPKAERLANDLRTLDVSPELVDTINVQALDQVYPTPVAALGGLYVMEGSVLGGIVISKHVQEHLGNAIEGKTSYLTIYGKDTGIHWRKFIQQFSSIIEPSQEKAVITGANDTFDLLSKWMS